MEARITGFKGGRRTSYSNHPIIECVEGDPSELIGKKVFWKTRTEKAIAGRVLKPHGKMAYLTKFDRGLPGNAVGDMVVVGRLSQKIKKKPKKSKPKAKPVKAKKLEKKKVKPKKVAKSKKKTKPKKKGKAAPKKKKTKSSKKGKGK
ncbi:MAG: hypothetical protein ACE5J5_02145 [Candidatus Hydrothermarchaeales archaeon]